jgi:hypothetical protein
MVALGFVQLLPAHSFFMRVVVAVDLTTLAVLERLELALLEAATVAMELAHQQPQPVRGRLTQVAAGAEEITRVG